MMHMTFYWGTTVTLLFDFWKTDSWISYILTLIACFLFSTFYQYLEDRRLRFKLASLNTFKTVINSSPSPGASIDSPLLLLRRRGRWSAVKVGGSVLFGINSALGFFMMLAVMSFNGRVLLQSSPASPSDTCCLGAAMKRRLTPLTEWRILAPALDRLRRGIGKSRSALLFFLIIVVFLRISSSC